MQIVRRLLLHAGFIACVGCFSFCSCQRCLLCLLAFACNVCLNCYWVLLGAASSLVKGNTVWLNLRAQDEFDATKRVRAASQQAPGVGAVCWCISVLNAYYFVLYNHL